MLPAPDLFLGEEPFWLWATVHEWAGEPSRSIRLRKPHKRALTADIVDLAGVADRLGVTVRSAAMWERSDLLPEPDYQWEKTRAWLWETIELWTRKKAGRIPGLMRPRLDAVDPATAQPIGGLTGTKPAGLPAGDLAAALAPAVDPIGELEQLRQRMLDMAESWQVAAENG